MLSFIEIIVDTVPESEYKDLMEFVSRVLAEIIPREQDFLNIVRHIIANYPNHHEFTDLLAEVRDMEIKTFLFATNEKGILINLVSFTEFPDELFSETDEVDCSIWFYEDSSDKNERVFLLNLMEMKGRESFIFKQIMN